ncbi:MAG: hypothetical protein ACE5H4_12135 [Candidatus Thorarchaeota archaeon]
MSVFSLGDESEMSDNDPAVARVMGSPSVSGSDTLVTRQGKEARFEGGTKSQ